MKILTLLWWALWCFVVQAANDTYLLGVGKADITGPIVDLTFMGYAESNQIGTGLRQRLYSRAFIIGDPNNPRDRVVYLVQDIQSGDTAVRDGIIKGLKALGPEYALYTKDNVAVTGTHSHSGPGGWTNYFLHHISSAGFDKRGWEAVVNGSLLSIKRAHQSLKEGRLSHSKIRIEDANINRSIVGYEANPAEERRLYKDNVDKDMSLLRFVDLSGKEMGVLTFFATHGTSMYSNNTLVTGDNKGVAAYILEKRMGNGFVAGFSQSNVGDVSPNILGSYCEGGPDNGKPCRLQDDTCGGKVQPCHARGPFFGLHDGGTKSCYEIGKRQANGAYELLQQMKTGNATPITGPIRSFHTFQNLSFYEFPHPNGTTISTCPPAFGYSFAAGTSDGPGIADFYQGINGTPNVNSIWPFLSGIIKTPTEEQRKCQAPKPILLDLGELHWPYEWIASVVDIQVMRVGPLFMIISTGEATTMAGRRWKEAIKQAAKKQIFKNNTTEPIVVLGGPSNTYTHYIATQEEYQIQRYEAASTIYGQHTLSAYIHLSTSKIRYLGDERIGSVESGHSPPINNDIAWSLIPGLHTDYTVNNQKFGQVITAPQSSYNRGVIASAIFMGANPRNNFRLEDTYAAVQKFVGTNSTSTGSVSVPTDILGPGSVPKGQPKGISKGQPKGVLPKGVLPKGVPKGKGAPKGSNNPILLSDVAERDSGQSFSPSSQQVADVGDIVDDWVTVRTDDDWDLVFEVKTVGLLFPPRHATLKWEIGKDVEPGYYRFVYNGDWRDTLGQIRPFKGVTPPFAVV